MSIEKADTWHCLQAACPYCGDVHEPEEIEDSEDVEVYDCPKCGKQYSYHLPDSNYH